MKELIEKAKHIVIFTHMAPDGDAMGSSLAMWHYVKGLSKVQSDKVPSDKVPSDKVPSDKVPSDKVPSDNVQCTIIVPNAFPAFFNWMPGSAQILIYEKEAQRCDTLIASADLFICTDFNDPKRIGPMGEKMLANPCPKILIDHHLKVQSDKVQSDKVPSDKVPSDKVQSDKVQSDKVPSTKEWYDEEHVDSSASSSCEIVYQLINDANGDAPLNDAIATCIYTGLMTDTGNFSYNSTRAELYDIIAALIRAGVKKDEIYNAVFNQYSTDRVRLTGYALYRKMRIYPEAHLALITLSADELERYHYQVGDTEGLVNMPLQIADVFYSVYMREERPKPGTPKPRIRISFRSQGDRPVNSWASEVFHGGGHANASGGELFGTLDQAVALFEQTYKKYLKI